MPLERNAKAKDVAKRASIRTARTLARAQALLLPEISDDLAAEEVSRRVAAHMATLPADERGLVRRKVIVAVHDLEGLVASLKSELSDLADELRTVSSHSGATSAYGRVGRRPPENRS